MSAMEEEPSVRNVTSVAGLIAGASVLLSVPLYFMYGGAPPAWNVLTRDLITLLTCAGSLVFVAGISHLAARLSPSAGFASLIAAGSGFIFIAISLVTTSLEAGVVFGAPDGSLDPTIDGPLAHANMLAHGPIKRLLTAIYLFAAGHAALRAGLLPAWLRRAGYLIALINLAFVPSLYFGTDPTDFYAVHSWANSAVTGSFLFYWMIAASIVLIVARRVRGTVAH
jgi:hypothetical protein